MLEIDFEQIPKSEYFEQFFKPRIDEYTKLKHLYDKFLAELFEEDSQEETEMQNQEILEEIRRIASAGYKEYKDS